MPVRLSRVIPIILVLALFLAACAPDDLDITPSPTPTHTPEPTATRAPTATPDPNAEAGAEAEAEAETEAAVGDNEALLNELIAALPGTINAGAISWRKASSEPEINEEEGGLTGTVEFNEAGGGLAEITLGVFDSPEAALAFYDVVAGRTRTLEQAETRENFPTPNLFGGGTYGSDAIFARDNLYLRISVPRFSSTAGDPLGPLGRQLFDVIDATLAS